MNQIQSRNRLNLPVHRQTSQFGTVIPAQADKTLASAASAAEGKRMFGSREAKEVQRAIAEVDNQHAFEIAEHQVTQIADYRLRMVRLEGERNRTEIRDRHNQRSGELAALQAEKSSEAILEQVSSHNRMNQMISKSECFDEDKQLLLQLAKIVTQQGMERITGESMGSDDH